MIRIFNVALVGLVIAAATFTYQVKHEAENKLAEISDLENRIALEKETMDLLKADWSHLSHPSRIEVLAERYKEDLQLQVTTGEQIIAPSELPGAPVFATGDAVGDLIAGEVKDDMTTGSVQGGN